MNSGAAGMISYPPGYVRSAVKFLVWSVSFLTAPPIAVPLRFARLSCSCANLLYPQKPAIRAKART